MGRRLRKRRKVAVLSPIQELSETRSPTPVKDVPSSANLTPSKPVEKVFQTAKITPESEDSTSHEYGSGDSFRDHLMHLVEEYQEDVMRMRRQLRQERKKTTRLEQEIHNYRTGYANYRLSYELDQAKILDLQNHLQKLEKSEKESFMEERSNFLDKANEKLKQISSKNRKEKISARNTMSNIAQTMQTTKKDLALVLPPLPIPSSKGQRIPHTQKSKHASLPVITGPKHIVASSKKTKSSLSVEKLQFPIKQASISTLIPIPPTYPANPQADDTAEFHFL